MDKSKVLAVFVLFCYILFAIFEFSGKLDIAFHMHSLLVPLITVIYIIFIKSKSKYFLLFLLFYSFSDVLGLTIQSLPYDETGILYEVDYYVGNTFYILAYLFLIIEISISICFKYLSRNLKIHTLVLVILSVYFIYVLQGIIRTKISIEFDFYFELIYNIATMLLLPLSLLNYFFRDNKKALYLFLGSLCIVFSEVMDIAYIFISGQSLINFLSTTLTLIAFYFYYQQSKLENISNKIGEQCMYAD